MQVDDPTTSHDCPVTATGYDHVGIRVTDRRRSLRFYERLGFRQTHHFPDAEANEMVTTAGVRINLIFNGAHRPGGRNVLLDEPVKLPGMTHPAFLVEDLAALQLAGTGGHRHYRRPQTDRSAPGGAVYP